MIENNTSNFPSSHYKLFDETNELKSTKNISVSREGEIIWLHGTTSATLALIKKTNMKSLIPTGQLRKKYNLVPLCGELGTGTITLYGSRKLGVNYEHISGMRATAHGIHTVMEYSQRALQFDIDTLRLAFENGLNALKASLDIFNDVISVKRFLKYLELTLLQLMLVDNKFNKQNHEINIKEIIAKVENKQTTVDLFANSIDTLIIKYLNSMLQKMIKQSDYYKDEEFINSIKNQFPIILASSNVPTKQFKHGIFDECVVEGEISFEKQIQFAFTETNHIDLLKKIFTDLGLNQIEVLKCSALANFISSAEQAKLRQKLLETYTVDQTSYQPKITDDDTNNKIMFSL